ncbi:MAG: nitroreductase family deazaflavin-dependent oxidoreductase [Actinobacteria bacterium]|nr:nitroreductase family deazaflavin-dependent oxidoreductase [Actinomycetota bacterium]
MKIPRRVARFNKYVTNPLQSQWAWLLPPYAIILHSGRRSHRPYRTPVMARFKRDNVQVRVLYGKESDWVRNLLAADGGEIVRRGRTFRLEDPRLDGSVLHARLGPRVEGRTRRGFPA